MLQSKLKLRQLHKILTSRTTNWATATLTVIGASQRALREERDEGTMTSGPSEPHGDNGLTLGHKHDPPSDKDHAIRDVAERTVLAFGRVGKLALPPPTAELGRTAEGSHLTWSQTGGK